MPGMIASAVELYFCSHLLASMNFTIPLQDDNGDCDKDPVQYPTTEELCELKRRLYLLHEEKLNHSNSACVPLCVGSDIASGISVHVIECFQQCYIHIRPRGLEDFLFCFGSLTGNNGYYSSL